MIELRSPCRRATPEDATAMAELINIAGEGMPLYLWTRIAESDESPWIVGQRRAKRESGGFSYRNTVLREDCGKVVASLVGYRLPDTPAPTNYDELPEMFVPLQQLEDLVPGTWYVNALATYPDYRGKGIGGELLSIAEQFAASTGSKGLSLIVSDANSGARRLYERIGYDQVATRPMVKESWENRGQNWILLSKST